MQERRKKRIQRTRRAIRTRVRIVGTAVRPRLTVFRSNRYLYAQLINDRTGVTLVAASSLALRSTGKLKRAEVARRIGMSIAEQAVKRGITEAAFDRGSYAYHGQVKALAEAARAGGLAF